MNKARREALDKLHGMLETAKADIEMLRDEEQEYADNMLDSLQSLEDVINSIEKSVAA